MREILVPALAVAGVATALLLLAATHPLLTRMAARNAVRRRSRVLIVTFGLLIGTAIIASSLTVGDTLEFIFTGDVYDRLDAVDVTVAREVNGELFDFPEADFQTLRSDAIARDLADKLERFDGLAPVLQRVMPVRNGLTGSQAITVQGLEDTYEGGFGVLHNRNGTIVSTAELPRGWVYVNGKAARDLNATYGNQLILFWGNTPGAIAYVQVRDIVRDEGKARYQHLPLVFLPLVEAQRAFGAPGKINLIRVSAPGPAIGSEQRSAPLAELLRGIVASHGWPLVVHEVKADGLAQAQRFGSQATELFLVMGSFAILAWVLLIVNVFVMLAEERKPEMGVARAVGMKRVHVTLTFLLEGALYVAFAAFSGALAGVALGWVMIQIFNVVFPATDQTPSLVFHVDPGSVVLAFAAGVLITLGAVVLTSGLVSRLNVVRAIRNLPEPPPDQLTRLQRWFVALAAGGGVVLLVRGFGLLRLPGGPLDLSSLPLAAAAVVLAGFVGYLASKVADREAIARLTARALEVAVAAIVIVGAYDLLAAPLGAKESIGAYRIAGVPLALLGLATFASRPGRARVPFSLAGVGTLWWLLLPPVDLVDEARDNVSVLFVETGALLVLGAILVAVFNTSPTLRFLLDRLGRRGRPVVRAAVTYPMAKKFRTGMTLAMFALTIFSITVIAMVQGLQAASLDKFVQGQSGGYQIAAYAQGYVPINDFTAELPKHNISLDNFVNREKGVATATVLSVRVNKSGDPDSREYTLWGVDNFLIERNTYGFLSFLPGITYMANGTSREMAVKSREEVWQALRLNGSYAVVDRGAAGADQFTPDFGKLRLRPGDHVWAMDGQGNATREFVILGILEQSLQFTQGIFVNRTAVLETYPLNVTRTAYFFQLAPGVNAARFRADLEREFLEFGLVTIDIREEIATQVEAANRILLLMQAYLALGLLVGITGLGVITIRAVVERRQEIGALRALGFTRRMVRNVFLLEIVLIASLGIVIGMALGIFLAYNVYRFYFASVAVFTIPWLHLGVVAAIAFGSTVLATASPALRASRLPPAEALRYIE